MRVALPSLHSRASCSLPLRPFKGLHSHLVWHVNPLTVLLTLLLFKLFFPSASLATKLICLMILEANSHRSGWQVTSSPVTMVIKTNCGDSSSCISCVIFIHITFRYLFPFLTVTGILMIHCLCVFFSFLTGHDLERTFICSLQSQWLPFLLFLCVICP